MVSWFPYLLVLIGALARLLPHAPNFTPIAALALFGAVYLKRRDALWVPLVAMALSDMVIGMYHPLVMASVYGCFLLTAFIGMRVRRKKDSPRWWSRVFGTSLLGSILFFLITNWAVWAFGEFYMKDIGGLMMSYGMGLPFFRNTLLGDLFYVGVLFGIAELLPHLVRYCQKNTISVRAH